MQNHPLNPMTDPDIRRWLRLQARGDVGLIPYSVVRQGSAAIAAALDAEAAAGRRLAVVDAITDDDLLAIGAALDGARLVTGGSGIALGLPENFRRAGSLAGRGSGFTTTNGPGIVLSGSCSSASMTQVANYLHNHPGLAVSPDRLMDGSITVEGALALVKQHWPKTPIVYSTAEPDAVKAAQARHGREKVAAAIESFFGEIARGLVEAGATRLVVGGGETSGAVVTALDLDHFRIGPEIDPGVPALASDGPHRVRLALKSGNFGAPDFYAKALRALGDA